MKLVNKADTVLRIEKQKKIISMTFVAALVIQIFLFYNVSNLGQEIAKTKSAMETVKVDTQQTLIVDTVRAQQRFMLNAVRQGWVQYLTAHPGTELLKKDPTGNYVYLSKEGKDIYFDPSTMVRDKMSNNFYTLRNKTTGQIIAEQVRLQWNKENVKTILDIVAAPVKAFGASGDVIVFDSYSGEMIIDNSEDCKDTPEVLGEDGRRYITLDYLHPANANPAATKRVIDQLMWRKDSDQNSGLVYYFSEPTDMGDNANDFAKYPLGQYKREFQEKIILPYESVGIDGQPMQITIVSGAQEQEIMAPYKKVLQEYKQSMDDVQNATGKSVVFPIASIGISLLVILLAMFGFRLAMYQSKIDCKTCVYNSTNGGSGV